MLRYSDLFNRNSVCIFTDASCIKVNGVTSTCAGVCVYSDNILIDMNHYIYHNESSQRGELHALSMGIDIAYKYYKYGKVIRIFSDSLNSILAIRERMFKWVKEENYLGPNGTIGNQDIILNMIKAIEVYNIPLELYHIKGHVNENNTNHLEISKDMFMRSNYITQDISNQLLIAIAIGNNQVDNYTREILNYEYRDMKYIHNRNAIVYEYDQNRQFVNFDYIRSLIK